MTLALLLTAVGGAWAGEETLLTTITGAGSNTNPATSANVSYSTEGVATLTFSEPTVDGQVAYFVSPAWGWCGYAITLTVTPAEGYTITKCIFYDDGNHTATDSEAPFIVETVFDDKTPKVNGTILADNSKGITKIEVYGYQSDPNAIDVTTNAASAQDLFTEASFEMPTSDVTVNYELVRDMSVKMSAEVGDGSDGYRIRIKKDGNDYVPVNDKEILISVSDDLDEEHPIDLEVNTDFTLLVQKKGDGDTWTDLSNEDKLSVGTFRYKVTGVGNYDGTIYSNEFQLFQGYEVVVPAGEYVTYYMEDEPLYADPETSTDAELYTITSVSGDKAILSNAIETAPSGTPLLVYNKGTEEKTFLLIPANAEPNLALDVYDGFIGTMQPTVIPASNATTDNYAFNGKQFVWVMNEIAIGANKAYLSIPKTNGNPKNIRLHRGNGETTGIDASLVNSEEVNSVWYDLNGRKLQGKPSLKGVYIKNGKKVVVH